MNERLFTTYPEWARRMAERYYSSTTSQFIIHGNINDLVPFNKNEGYTFLSLHEFLNKAIFGTRDTIIYYDRSVGITFPDKRMLNSFLRTVRAYDTVKNTQFQHGLPKDPARALALIENYMRVRVTENKGVALIIDFAETVTPSGELSYMSEQDRQTLIMLRKLSSDPQFLRSDVTICLVTENLADLHQKIVRNPYVAIVEIPLPDELDRLNYLEHLENEKRFIETGDLNLTSLAKQTSGLSRQQINQIIAEALKSRQPVSQDFIHKRKKTLIEAQCYGLLEFMESDYDLEMVAGHGAVKRKLRSAVKAMKQGLNEVLPMGYLICGAVGTGKSFLVSCFAGEAGMPCVKMLNFRSQWQGVTEANLQRLLNIFKAMGPICVIVDEADAFLGNRGAGGDSGTSNRVFAQIAAFMGNTAYRGKVIWFLITCRPDLLPVDLKRQGRAEEHLALFYPQTIEEMRELFTVMMKKTGVKVDVEGLESHLEDLVGEYSGSAIEAALIRARFSMLEKGEHDVSANAIKKILEDFIPPTYAIEVEYQNLAAVLECTSRELIPKKYLDMGREVLSRRAKQLRLLSEE